MTQSTRAVISSADSPFGQLWRFESVDELVHGYEHQPVFPDRPIGLLSRDLVRFQSLIVPVVPLANSFGDNMIRYLGEVARQEVESIMSTTTW
jgi:hypothetical protein